MKKILFVATVVRLHINMFHQPYIKWFHEQGWEVDVAANNDYYNKEECVIPYCDHFYCLPFERSPFRKGNLIAYKDLKKIIDFNQYDIIHCHTPVGGVVARLAAFRARKNGTKVVYTAHGFHFYKGADLINWLVYYPVEKIFSYITDIIITMNEEDYCRAQSFKAKKVEIVNGVGLDLEKFSPVDTSSKKYVREELGLKEDDIFCISVAQLIKRKNHKVLIHSIKKANDDRLHLFICGDGVEEEKLKAEAKELGIENQIHFLGFRKDVYKLCSSADVFMFGSFQEGLPVAIMEAMACGLPIIASDIRGNIDLIDEDKGGFLVNPNDVDGFVNSLKKILDKPYKLEEMKKYNLEKIQQYGIENVRCQMAKIYSEIM